MSKRIAAVAGVALSVFLSAGLIVPALAYQTPVDADIVPVAAPAVVRTDVLPTVPTPYGEFAPKSIQVPVVTADVPADTANYTAPKSAKSTAARTTTRKTATTTSAPSSPAQTPAPAPTPAPVVEQPKTDSTADDLATAKSVLASLQAKYQYLDGVTVAIDETPNNYQAVAYYSRGKIVISPTHTASISTILKHEIWHIIDYRDNGTMDWGERVAPANYADYLK